MAAILNKPDTSLKLKQRERRIGIKVLYNKKLVWLELSLFDQPSSAQIKPCFLKSFQRKKLAELFCVK